MPTQLQAHVSLCNYTACTGCTLRLSLPERSWLPGRARQPGRVLQGKAGPPFPSAQAGCVDWLFCDRLRGFGPDSEFEPHFDHPGDRLDVRICPIDPKLAVSLRKCLFHHRSAICAVCRVVMCRSELSSMPRGAHWHASIRRFSCLQSQRSLSGPRPAVPRIV